MRILSLRPNGSDGWGGPLYTTEFERAVSKITDYKHAGVRWPLHRPNESMEQTVRRIYGGDPPDWVFHSPLHAEVPRKRDYRVGFYSSDIHGYISLKLRGIVGYTELINSKGLDAVFMKYQYIRGWKEPKDYVLRNLKPKAFFLPYSVNPKKYMASDDRTHDITMIGSVGGVYPLRRIFWRELPAFCKERKLSLLLNKPEFPKCTFDGASKYASDPRYYLHKSYESALARSRFFVFDSSRYGYPLQKYFEGMACGCVCVADRPEHAQALGFVDGETYVEVNADNWRERIDYYLENPEEVDRIGKNARELVLKRHTHEIRARKFLKMLEVF